jgi:hypothetical protein
MFKKVHVYDLDGVLVDTSHRYRTDANGKTDMLYWAANHTAEKIALDKILPMAKNYLADCLNPEIYCILCTVRSAHVLDFEFVVGQLGTPDKILMVGEPHDSKTFTKDYILKRRELQRVFNLIALQNLPRTLFEDNAVTIRNLASMFTHTVYIESNQGAK